MKGNGSVFPVKALIVFVACVLVCLLCAGLASFVQGGFGSVSLETGFFVPEKSEAREALPVRIAYKLYRPREAALPAPAVLLMHGYQNDKETSSAFAIELARRGIVVLSVDLYGHGDSSPGMRGRGAGRFKLTDLDKPLSGPGRYMVMLTFSVLDFFRPEISSGLADSSMGGKSAYRYLASLPFVDSSRIGISGHSMGTWASWSVAAAFPDHRAVVLQCGEIVTPDLYDAGTIKFNNVLLLQAHYDEFDMFRDYQPNVLGLEKTPRRYRDFMGQDSPVDWNKTYGSFANGSARRMELLQTNHRLTTHNGHALTAAMDWFTAALNVDTPLEPSSHIYMAKETLVFLSMLAALISMLPLFLILCHFKFFSILSQPVTGEAKMLPPKNRSRSALIAILISGLTFPFLCQLGHGLIPLPENIFRMTAGNGFITWLTFLMLVSLVMLLLWYRRGMGKEAGWNLRDLGLANPPSAIPKALIMTLILTAAVYLLVCISSGLFKVDFRFIWPLFRPFSGLRFGLFLVYLPFYAAFFTINAGAKLYGQLRLPLHSSLALTQLIWWGYSVLVMLGGVLLIALIEYIPFFMGLGPGVDLLFSSLFGGPFMSAMILIVPQFTIFFFLSTWFFRKSSSVYTGSFVLAVLASWVVCGGSAIF